MVFGSLFGAPSERQRYLERYGADVRTWALSVRKETLEVKAAREQLLAQSKVRV
jgi:hypothetical protein